jgi:hypothetical protein
MTSGTVPSPPEASTHGADTRKRAGQGATAKTGGARQRHRLVNLVLTSVDKTLINRVLFARPAPGPGGEANQTQIVRLARRMMMAWNNREGLQGALGSEEPQAQSLLTN